MPYIPVTTLDLIPFGTGKLVEIGRVEVALFRVDQGIYATANVCPHQGAALADGELKGEEIICPWHHWCFNVKDGISPLNPRLKIKTYPVQLDGNQVSILLYE